MAYNKTTWKTGDTITAEKLNHAEQGIADASTALIVNVSVSGELEITRTLDKTAKEIYNAIMAGVPVWTLEENTDNGDVYEAVNAFWLGYASEGDYVFQTYSHFYGASTENDYPSETT